jgi:hypothetical protein
MEFYPQSPLLKYRHNAFRPLTADGAILGERYGLFTSIDLSPRWAIFVCGAFLA